MPDLSSLYSSLSSPSSSIIRETHLFTTRTFTKVNLLGGSFNVKLYHNTNLISIDIEQNDTLTIRMIENLNISNKTNITLFIIYQQLNEFSIDGKINIQCVNLIQPNLFHLYHRDSGLIKLKLTVDKLNAYLHSIGRVKLCRHVNDEVTLKSIRAGDVDCRNC
ncbi:unnamed protein product [Rotaria sordida]|uniref:Putative auto-transporter adhesin head GIN domain-containing protein n=1 Tax=Rotaria sordida TaxID=392033 RepID=A0A813ML58_9BILA|nr:unnamed protein product [Rotaria sordida]CAF0747020.1 unnamed protein product [Rotaria sordida]